MKFSASEYRADSDGNAIIDSEGKVVGEFTLGTAPRDDTAAGAFPRQSGIPQPFDYVDRGITPAERTIQLANCDDGARDTAAIAACRRDVPRARNEDRYEQRYSYETRGTLSGASGTFRCAADDTNTPCTVQNTGDKHTFAGTWVFVPDANASVRVMDMEWMRFGWWSRQDRSTGGWSFHTFHGGTAATTDVTAVTGSATYTGPAAGYYAMSLPGTTQSRQGQFDATATLRANFDTDKLSGMITDFQQESEWTLTLKEAEITDAGAASNTSAGVSWISGDETVDGGGWAAQLYSNVPLNSEGIAGIRPAGIAGTFSAAFGTVGKLVGAFGAHYSGQ